MLGDGNRGSGGWKSPSGVQGRAPVGHLGVKPLKAEHFFTCKPDRTGPPGPCPCRALMDKTHNVAH